MDTIRLDCVAFAVMTLGATACSALNDADPDILDFRSGSGGRLTSPARANESRSGGGEWINNGLVDPQISGVSVDHPLVSSNGLNQTYGWLANEDDDGTTVIRYMIECALAEGQQVTKNYKGNQATFYGRLGLAPQWRDGACDLDCQRWVSACIMARTNPVGQVNDIWLQGGHPALGFGDDPNFPLDEGGFYGNLFAPDQVEHTCQGSAEGLDAATAVGRSCTSDESPCGFESDGDCLLTADCQLTSDGSLPLTCRPDPSGPDYPVIFVHVTEAPAE